MDTINRFKNIQKELNKKEKYYNNKISDLEWEIEVLRKERIKEIEPYNDACSNLAKKIIDKASAILDKFEDLSEGCTFGSLKALGIEVEDIYESYYYSGAEIDEDKIIAIEGNIDTLKNIENNKISFISKYWYEEDDDRDEEIQIYFSIPIEMFKDDYFNENNIKEIIKKLNQSRISIVKEKISKLQEELDELRFEMGER